MDLDGTYSINETLSVSAGTLTLRGSWNNASTITQSDVSTTINLGGVFTVDDLGAPTNFVGSAGTVNIFGELLPGALLAGEDKSTLKLDSERTWRLNGSTVRDVQVADDEDSDTPASLVVTSADGTLDNVTLGVDTTLQRGSVVTVQNKIATAGNG